MKLLVIVVLLIAAPALADEYDAGYSSGYYGSSASSSMATQYGRGYDDGSYDASLDDTQARQTSEDFEAALAAEQYLDVQH